MNRKNRTETESVVRRPTHTDAFVRKRFSDELVGPTIRRGTGGFMPEEQRGRNKVVELKLIRRGWGFLNDSP